MAIDKFVEIIRTIVSKIRLVLSLPVPALGMAFGGNHRERIGINTKCPNLLVTDMAIWRPDAITRELTVTSLHSGITREQMSQTVGWEIKCADDVKETSPPNTNDLEVLRDLIGRTAKARQG